MAPCSIQGFKLAIWAAVRGLPSGGIRVLSSESETRSSNTLPGASPDFTTGPVAGQAGWSVFSATGQPGFAQVTTQASVAGYIVDNVRATYAVGGAVEEDHRNLRSIESDAAAIAG